MLRLLVIASIWATAYGGKQDRSFAQISIDGPVDAPQPKGSALDREIQALDDLIKTQQKKLAALGALRKAGTAPPDDDEGTCTALREASRELACGSNEKRRREAPKDVDDVLVMRGEITASSIYEVLPFRTRARPAPQPMRRKRGHQQTRAPRYDYVNILCVVASSGIATFYESGGAVVAELDLEQKNVKTLAFDGGDQPLLATANDDGVRLHNLTLWRGERVIAGRRPRYVYDEEAPPPPIPEPSTRTASGLGLVIGREVDLVPLPMQVETKKGLVEKPSPPKLVSVFPWRSVGAHIATLDEGNRFILWTRNGTQRGSLNLTASSLTRAGSTFAAASDNVVRFVSAGRWQTMAVECRGPPSPVSDVVFDPLRPELVHVAYETGTILTFRKPPVYDYDDVVSERQCRLAGKLPQTPHSSEVKLAVVRGFLISSSSTHIAVHNTSSSSPEHYYLVGAKAVSPKKARDLRATVVSGMYAPEVVLAVREDSTIRVYESLLKHEPPLPADVAWMRVPILLIGLVVVFGVQVFRGGGGGGRRRGRGGLSPSDMDRLNQMAGLMGDNRGFGSPAARGRDFPPY